MALNKEPIFVAKPRTQGASISTGATAVDGTGSTIIFQAHATVGSRIHAITAIPTGTISTNTVIRLFHVIGSTYYILCEIACPTPTVAQGTPISSINLLDYVALPALDPVDRFLLLNNTDAVAVSVLQTIEAPLHVIAFGGDFLES